MVDEWDDDGSFESLADQPLLEVDLTQRNPFDLSKALDGAALEECAPMSSGFDSTPSSIRPVTSQKQLKN